jgi:hypothetical protein
MSVNICYNSSWAILPPQVYGVKQVSACEEAKATEEITKCDKKNEFSPNQFFGKAFNFDMKTEKKIIVDLRKWAGSSFANSKMISTRWVKNLADVPASGGPQEKDGGKFYDFDL